MKLVLCLLFAAVLSFGGAAATANAPSVNRAAVAGLTDSQIESDIRLRLNRSPKISLDKFTVKVQGGIATFEGKTNVIQHKGVATRMAKSAGARAVVNRIQISEEARRKAAQRLAAGRAKKAAQTETAAQTVNASNGPKRAVVQASSGTR